MAKSLLFWLAFLTLASPLEAKVLHFWQFWPQEWLAPELAKFEAETGITVQVERLTWGDGLNKILTAMAAGQSPDVMEIGSTWVAGFSSGLSPLEPGPLASQLNGWDPAAYQGRFYAVPWTLSTNALFVNLDLLEQAKAELPLDWAGLLDAATKVQGLGGQVRGYGVKTGTYTTSQTFLPFVWSKGTRLLKPQGGTGLLDPAFREALEFYLKLKQVGLFDENPVVRKAFLEGKVGMMLEEPGQVERFKRENPKLRFAVVPLPPPERGGQSIAFGGGQMLAVAKGSASQAEAEQLVRFLVRPEVTAAITSRITTLFPAHKDAAASDFYRNEHPELLVFLQILQQSTAPPSHPRWVEIQEVFSQGLERVMYGLDEPAAALETLQKDIEPLLTPKVRAAQDGADRWGLFLKVLGLTLGLLALGYGLWRAILYQGASPADRAKTAKAWRYNKDTLVFLGPWLLVFGVFSLYPIAHSVYLSFTDFEATDGLPPAWVGWANYGRMWLDPHFWASMGHSFYFVLGTVPAILVLALVLAVVLNQGLRFKTFYRVSFFVPVVTSVMVIAALFVELYGPEGLVNQVASWFGLPERHWLKDPVWALPAIMVMNIWASFGFYTLMLLAGLQAIPQEYYEASGLEGAGKVRQFFTITLPLLRPTLLVAAVMDSILAFQVFGEVLLMTRGGPLRSSETAVYYLYDLAFHRQEMGYASAVAYGVFLVLLAFTGLQWGLYGRKDRP